jgi:gliding motility-associated protein GldM
VDNNGVGKISFTASGGNYIEGLAKKTWTGKITSKTPDGKDTTYIVNQDYYVAQPLIEVEAEAVKALYRNCGNKLNIKVPALGNNYNPRFTAEGATITPGANRGMLTVVPTGSQVFIKVNSDGNYIGQEKYGVRLVPLPTIEIKVNNAIPNPITGVDASTVRTLTVRAIPDKEFARLLPDDATYIITKVNVRTARGRVGKTPREYPNGNINLSSFGAFTPGERMIIEVLEVKRRTFRGDWEVVPMPAGLTTFQVNLN